MHETLLVAFATMFATVGPLDVGIVFATLTAGQKTRERMGTALRGLAIAALILMTFAIFGDSALDLFGISLPALRIAGGILLLLIAIDMVFARPSGATGATEDEAREARSRPDISVFPLATPLLAGPGAMGAVVLLMAETDGDWEKGAAVLIAVAAVLGVAFAAMMLASQLQRLMGRTGVHVVARIFGVLLAGLAVQFMLDGLARSGLFALGRI